MAVLSAVMTKSSYVKEYDEIAYKLCLLGLDDEDLANFFSVSLNTINYWKKHYLSFYMAIANGREIADGKVANALFKKATGYSYKAIKFATHQGVITDKCEYTEYVPPDTSAAIFWLKNRQGARWREKAEAQVPDKDFSLSVTVVEEDKIGD